MSFFLNLIDIHNKLLRHLLENIKYNLRLIYSYHFLIQIFNIQFTVKKKKNTRITTQ
jgi:hypothetical protein